MQRWLPLFLMLCAGKEAEARSGGAPVSWQGQHNSLCFQLCLRQPRATGQDNDAPHRTHHATRQYPSNTDFTLACYGSCTDSTRGRRIVRELLPCGMHSWNDPQAAFAQLLACFCSSDMLLACIAPVCLSLSFVFRPSKWMTGHQSTTGRCQTAVSLQTRVT